MYDIMHYHLGPCFGHSLSSAKQGLFSEQPCQQPLIQPKDNCQHRRSSSLCQITLGAPAAALPGSTFHAEHHSAQTKQQQRAGLGDCRRADQNCRCAAAQDLKTDGAYFGPVVVIDRGPLAVGAVSVRVFVVGDVERPGVVKVQTQYERLSRREGLPA